MSKALELERRIVKCKVNLSADDWKLYVHSNKNECNSAARMLNSVIEKLATDPNIAINDFLEIMQTFMHKYKNLGALDSEPQWVLKKLAAEIYNE